MSIKRLFIGFLFLDFAAFTGWILFTQDNLALLESTLANPWGLQIFADLCIMAMFGSMWLYRDAKKKGINPWPWIAAILPTGSLAVLAYATFHGIGVEKDQPAARTEASLAS